MSRGAHPVRILALGSGALVCVACGSSGSGSATDDGEPTASTPAYVAMQHTMKVDITENDRRPVTSVSCRPRIRAVALHAGRHLRCTVVFTDGSHYVSTATMRNEQAKVGPHAPDTFTWDPPPAR